MKTKEFEKIEKLIWSNKKLEKALDEILIDYEDFVFTGWAYQELINLPRNKRNKKLEEVGAFDFCNGNPMEWAKQYCVNDAFIIYDDGAEIDKDKLIKKLISNCQNYMMHDMFAQCDF